MVKVVNFEFSHSMGVVSCTVYLEDGRTAKATKHTAFFGLGAPTEDDKRAAYERAVAAAKKKPLPT
ncbi:MAG: hypothetical protein KJZ80_11595 [Hyphomicrobiaceae bacterium]|nr:hypothetical protein [Hyphomicrobiaceae bacterium]